MDTPNSFQQVVAADNATARKALSELGSAPLPPVALIRRRVNKMMREARLERRSASFLSQDFKERFFNGYIAALTEVLKLLPKNPRATGGNDDSTTDSSIINRENTP